MADWTATIRGLTVGDGTDYPLVQPGITGLGVPSTRTADQERGHLSGDVGGDDVLQKRVLTIPVGIDADTASAAWTLFVALKTAWAPSYEDIPLVLAIADTSITYNGRPRGLDADLVWLGKGWVSALCVFEALNPFAVGEAVDVEVGSP
jgi:hypothetical protein